MEVWAFGEILDWRYFDFWRENIRPYVYFALRILGEKRLLFKHHCGGFQKRGKELVLPAAILFSCGKSPLFVICKRFLIDVYIRALHQRELQKIGRDTLSFLSEDFERTSRRSIGVVLESIQNVLLLFLQLSAVFSFELLQMPWQDCHGMLPGYVPLFLQCCVPWLCISLPDHLVRHFPRLQHRHRRRCFPGNVRNVQALWWPVYRDACTFEQRYQLNATVLRRHWKRHASNARRESGDASNSGGSVLLLYVLVWRGLYHSYYRPFPEYLQALERRKLWKYGNRGRTLLSEDSSDPHFILIDGNAYPWRANVMLGRGALCTDVGCRRGQLLGVCHKARWLTSKSNGADQLWEVVGAYAGLYCTC